MEHKYPFISLSFNNKLQKQVFFEHRKQISYFCLHCKQNPTYFDTIVKISLLKIISKFTNLYLSYKI